MSQIQNRYQTASHAAALKAAKELVTQLESEGPAKGWGTDNQHVAVRVLEAIGRSDEADRIGTELNAILFRSDRRHTA